MCVFFCTSTSTAIKLISISYHTCSFTLSHSTEFNQSRPPGLIKSFKPFAHNLTPHKTHLRSDSATNSSQTHTHTQDNQQRRNICSSVCLPFCSKRAKMMRIQELGYLHLWWWWWWWCWTVCWWQHEFVFGIGEGMAVFISLH